MVQVGKSSTFFRLTTIISESFTQVWFNHPGAHWSWTGFASPLEFYNKAFGSDLPPDTQAITHDSMSYIGRMSSTAYEWVYPPEFSAIRHSGEARPVPWTAQAKSCNLISESSM